MIKIIGSNFNSPGWKIVLTEDFKSSNAIKTISMETIKPEIYSILPWPKGWSLSGFLLDSLNPIIEMSEEPESDRLLKASAVIAIEPVIAPAMIFAKNKIIFKNIPTPPQMIPYVLLEVWEVLQVLLHFLHHKIKFIRT